MYKNRQHYERVSQLLTRLGKTVPSQRLLAFIYVIAGNETLFNHAEAFFDPTNHQLTTTDWYAYPWLSGNDWQLALLAYNLYTGKGFYAAKDEEILIDPISILSDLPEEAYALAINSLHVRFHKMEFVTFTYDPNEQYD